MNASETLALLTEKTYSEKWIWFVILPNHTDNWSGILFFSKSSPYIETFGRCREWGKSEWTVMLGFYQLFLF